jgi:hypothetical protein
MGLSKSFDRPSRDMLSQRTRELNSFYHLVQPKIYYFAPCSIRTDIIRYKAPSGTFYHKQGFSDSPKRG